MELVECGNLYDLIMLCGYFQEPNARFYFHQIIEALNYYHNHSSCHRDLKLENILIDKDYNLKITDFGSSTSLDKVTPTTMPSLDSYKAPEILQSNSYSGPKVDLWAAGVILFTMVSQEFPFVPKREDKHFMCLARNRTDIFWRIHG